MTIFRWIMGVLSALLAGGWLITFAIYLANGDDRFKELGTRLRQWATMFVLMWFNIEIWGRVVWILITWPG
jgi:hypothetical protein